MKVIFSINNETVRIVFQDIPLIEVDRIKDTLAISNNVSPDDVQVEYRTETELEGCEFYVDGNGVIRLQGTVFNKQINGIRASIDIHTKSGLERFLDEHKGDAMQILAPLLVTEERPKDSNWKAGDRNLFDSDF